MKRFLVLKSINRDWNPDCGRYCMIRIGNTKYLGYFVDEITGMKLLSLGIGKVMFKKIGSTSMLFCYYLTEKEAKEIIRQTLVSLVKRKYWSARKCFCEDYLVHCKKKKESIIFNISEIWSF